MAEGEDARGREIGVFGEGIEADAGEVGEVGKVVGHWSEEDGAVSGTE